MMTDELWREEEKKTLERIAKLTELGKVKWECVEYNPLCFMNEDKVLVLNDAIYGQKYGQILSQLVLNFVKYGNPNNKYLPK